MAKIGFKSIHMLVKGEEDTVTRYTLDKAKGGAIEASISGLGAEATTVYASNVPFYVSAKGTGETEVSFNTFDIMAGGAYNAVLGIEQVTVDGAPTDKISVVGSETEAPYIGIVFESQNADGDTVYMGLTKVRLSHPDIALNTSEGGGTEPNTDELSGAAVSDSRGYVYACAVGSTTMTLDKFCDFIANVSPS